MANVERYLSPNEIDEYIDNYVKKKIRLNPDIKEEYNNFAKIIKESYRDRWHNEKLDRVKLLKHLNGVYKKCIGKEIVFDDESVDNEYRDILIDFSTYGMDLCKIGKHSLMENIKREFKMRHPGINIYYETDY